MNRDGLELQLRSHLFIVVYMYEGTADLGNFFYNRRFIRVIISQ